MQRSARHSGVLLAALLVLTSCAAGADPTIAPTDDDSPPASGDPTVELDCEREGYPCTPAEVDPTVTEREGRYVDQISDMLDDSGSYADALTWILDQEGVVEAEAGEYELTFRLAGGQPMHVSEIVEDDAMTSESPPSITLAHAVAVAGDHVDRPTSPDASVVGVGTTRDDRQNRKRALFLDPLFPDKNAGFVEMIPQLEEIPDYRDGGIIIRRGRDVTPDSFLGWDDYDAIFVATHGGITRGSWLLTGLYERRDRTLARPEQCEALMAGWTDMNTRCVAFRHNVRWFLGVAVRGDFFLGAYGTGGLDRTIIYIGGCNGMNMDSMLVALAGSSSAYVSWSETTMSPWWEGATLNLLNGLFRRWPVVVAATALCNEGIGCVVPATGAQFGVYNNGPDPSRLTLYDVPTLVDPKSRARLTDGVRLEAMGIPGDDEHDQLRIDASLIGIVDPSQTGLDPTRAADLYTMRFFVDGELVAADNLGNPMGVDAETTFLGDAEFEYSFTAVLPFDVDPNGTKTTLKVEVDLPEGGVSDYEVDVTLFGVFTPCELVEREIERVLIAFGSPLPLKDFGPPGGLTSECLIRLEGPNPDASSALFAPDLTGYISVERLATIYSTVSFAAQGLEGPVAPVPSLGPDALLVEVPHGLLGDVGSPTPHVLFAHAGRVWLVKGEYSDAFEVWAISPDQVDVDLELANTPNEAAIRVAEVLLELMGGPQPDPPG